MVKNNSCTDMYNEEGLIRGHFEDQTDRIEKAATNMLSCAVVLRLESLI